MSGSGFSGRQPDDGPVAGERGDELLALHQVALDVVYAYYLLLGPVIHHRAQHPLADHPLEKPFFAVLYWILGDDCEKPGDLADAFDRSGLRPRSGTTRVP